jgi:hypothetical protein
MTLKLPSPPPKYDVRDQAEMRRAIAELSKQLYTRGQVDEFLREEGYVNVHTYGAKGDGTTDDTLAFQDAINAATAGSVIHGEPGRTYVLGSGTVDGSDVLRTSFSDVCFDFPGSTWKYGGANDLTVGGDGGAIALLNVLHSRVRVNVGFDLNSKARYALAYGNGVVGSYITATIRNRLETGGTWAGIQMAVSSDVSGVAISGRAKALCGMLVLPNCSFLNSAGTAVGSHADVTAALLGGSQILGNTTTMALVMSDAVATGTAFWQRIDTLGVALSQYKRTGNEFFGDLILHDLGAQVIELYGTSGDNSEAFGMEPGEYLGLVAKSGAYIMGSHANIGTDAVTPNYKLSGGTAQDQGLFDMLGWIRSSGWGTGIVTKTADYTATLFNTTILVDATGGNRTITLPTAASQPGMILHIKKIDASGNSVTIDGNGSETIDGATTKATTTQYAGWTIQSDGSAWYILS